MTSDETADEAARQEQVEAGLASAREQPLVEAAEVERALRRELESVCERAERRKVARRNGPGKAWR
ncbi:MAG: hypothetical protein ACYTG2_05435 [Planctomycetota bacterium]|jgi:hypothetical protein